MILIIFVSHYSRHLTQFRVTLSIVIIFKSHFSNFLFYFAQILFSTFIDQTIFIYALSHIMFIPKLSIFILIL